MLFEVFTSPHPLYTCPRLLYVWWVHLVAEAEQEFPGGLAEVLRPEGVEGAAFIARRDGAPLVASGTRWRGGTQAPMPPG